MLPVPVETGGSVVPNTASKQRLPFINKVAVGFVPCASPSHCRNDQPEFAFADTVAKVLLGKSELLGEMATVPPPLVNASNEYVGTMFMVSGSASDHFA